MEPTSDGDTCGPELRTPLGRDAGPSDPIEATVSAGDASRSIGAAEAAFGLARGDLLGRYVVLEPLGSGAMGIVVAAFDPHLDRKIAIKLLRPHSHAGEAASEARERLLREARALASVDDPHVVKVHDAGLHAGRVFVAMEFVAGITLRAWLAKRPPPGAVLDAFADAGAGLAAAHARGIVHRDFKPDNVMIDAERRVRVMDFGLARSTAPGSPARAAVSATSAALPDTALDAVGRADALAPPAAAPIAAERSERRSGAVETHEAGLPSSSPGSRATDSVLFTRAGALLGTPAYMAPEQHLGEPAGPAADQFAFAVALYEALVGQRPFVGKSALQIAVAVTSGTRRPRPSRAGAHAPVLAALDRAFAVDPAARYPSMDALLAAVARARTRRRVRLAMVLVTCVSALAIALPMGARASHLRRLQACAAEASAIDTDWSVARRAEIEAHFVATGAPKGDATARAAARWIDERVADWKEATSDACVRHVQGHLDDALFDKARWCLQAERAGITALVNAWSRADTYAVQSAVSAAAGLEPAHTCLDPVRLSNLPTPPTATLRAQVDVVRAALADAEAAWALGDYERAHRITEDAAKRAHTLDWPPLEVEVQALGARVLDGLGRYPQARDAYQRAYFGAVASSTWHIAAAAAIGLEGLLANHLAQPEAARAWADHAAAVLVHAGDPLRLREAYRLNSLAIAERGLGEFSRARAHYREAKAIWEAVYGPEHPEVAIVLNNLAVVAQDLGEPRESLEASEAALAIWEGALGPEHPDVAGALHTLAGALTDAGELDRAQKASQRSLSIWIAAFGAEHPEVGLAYNSLGHIEHARGDLAASDAAFARADAIWVARLGPLHPHVAANAVSWATVQRELDRREDANATLRRAEAILAAAHGADDPETTTVRERLACWALVDRGAQAPETCAGVKDR